MKTPFKSRRHDGAGVALIITLAALVLISALILAFFSAELLQRQISFGSSGQNRAEILAKAAMDTTVGDLESEIQAGSTTYSTNYVPIYIPNNNFVMVPFRTVNPTTFPNLVKMSQGGTNFWGTNFAWSGSASYSPATGPMRANSSTSFLTTQPSLNGRLVAASSWTKPYLVDSSVTNQIPTPSWILITRQGPMSNAATATLPSVSTMANSTPTNMNYVVGRYAYAIYDEGGLIDANAAGNNIGATYLGATYNARRGRLQMAAMSQLPLIDTNTTQQGDANNTTAASNLVAWRSPYGQTDSNWLMNPTNLFLSVDPSGTYEQAFVTRQDLIQFFKYGYTNTYGTSHVPSLNALQYLSTFTRELNAPNYTPNPNRALVLTATATSTMAGNPNTYGKDNYFNPSLVNMRDSNGKPVVKQRFPLARLAWLTYLGPIADTNGNLNPNSDPGVASEIATYEAAGIPQSFLQQGTPANILTYFGLAWDSTDTPNQWVYTRPDVAITTPPTQSTYINYLSTIPSARATTTGPDFFELLLATIDVGSLGRDSGTPGPKNQWGGHASATGSPNPQDGVESLVQLEDQNVYRHVLQIGANMIDQVTPDSFPTALMMGTTGTTTSTGTYTVTGSTTVYGVKNLPYPLRLFPIAAQHVDPVTPSNQQMQMWLEVQMWNPHQQGWQGGALTPPTGTLYPTAFRVRDDPNAPSTVQVGFYGSGQISGTYALTNSGALYFTNGAPSTFTSPTLLSTNNSTVFSYTGGSTAGTYATNDNKGNVYAYTLSGWQPVWNYSPGTNYVYGLYCGGYMGFYPSSVELYPAAAGTGTSLVFEYQQGNNWYPYAKIRYKQYGGYIEYPFCDNYPKSAAETGPYHYPTAVPGWAYKTNWVDKTTSPWTTNAGDQGYYGEHEMDIHVDPRTDRFGLQSAVEYGFITNTPRPNGSFGNGGNGDPADAYQPNSAAFFIPTTTGTGGDIGLFWGWPETLSDNVTNVFTLVNNSYVDINEYYEDPDGVVRPGEGAYQTTATTTDTAGRPMNITDGTGESRPIILNRPFRSVGELGYTFRDEPWKSLNFFTTNSGDAGLLDAFSLDDTTTAATNGATPVVAGKINLNTRNTYALDALLMGALKDELYSAYSTNTMAQTETTKVATALLTRTTNTASIQGPFSSKADLVLKFSGDLNHSPVATYANNFDSLIKSHRETAIRALADAGNVRTWNLMIDIIVQSGRYAATSTTYQQFVVEGEKHYWLHVAIDRYTGVIVDEQLEPVYD